jgi:hypothetical protein
MRKNKESKVSQILRRWGFCLSRRYLILVTLIIRLIVYCYNIIDIGYARLDPAKYFTLELDLALLGRL